MKTIETIKQILETGETLIADLGDAIAKYFSENRKLDAEALGDKARAELVQLGIESGDGCKSFYRMIADSMALHKNQAGKFQFDREEISDFLKGTGFVLETVKASAEGPARSRAVRRALEAAGRLDKPETKKPKTDLEKVLDIIAKDTFTKAHGSAVAKAIAARFNA